MLRPGIQNPGKEAAVAGRHSRSRVSEAREQMYRDLVLECAERVFARAGYHGARAQDIAAEAGISLQTLYATFPGKAEIFAELHEFRGREFLARIEAALAEPLPASESLCRAVLAFVEYLVEHPDYQQVDLREGRSWAIGDVEASPTFQAGIRLWTDLMRRGIEEQSFCDDDPELMATTAFGIMQIQLAVLVAREPTPDAREIAGRIHAQLARAFRRSPSPAEAGG